jgi:signal transduction histidine kinase
MIKIKRFRFRIVLVLFISIITIGIIMLSRNYILHQAELRLQDVMLQAQSLHHYVQREMHPAMYNYKKENRMPEDFYAPEILSSSYITRHVFHLFNEVRKGNKLPPVEYRMASKNPRNKLNQATEFESELLDRFNSESTLKEHISIVEDEGVKYLMYAKPFLRIQKRCLACHGTRENAPEELASYYKWDSGFNLEIGSIPAIEVIKTPIVAENKAYMFIVGIIIIASMGILLLVFLNSRLLKKNGIIARQKDEMEETLNKLKETQGKLIETEKLASLGTLTAGVAHEINNPLNYIMGGYVGLLRQLKKHPELENERNEVLLNSIRQGVDKVSNIVKGLNQFSRDNQSKNETCAVHNILDNCILILNNQLKHRIEIKKNYANGSICIIGNVGKLHQAFLNVLSNAIQSIDDMGRIVITTSKKGEQSFIHIMDSGRGMPKEMLPKITDPFFTTKPPGEGTGLGLSITLSIIKETGGEITFDSEIGKGTTVTIMLPINSQKTNKVSKQTSQN